MLTITQKQPSTSHVINSDPAVRASAQSASLDPFLDSLAESAQRLRAQRDADQRDEQRDDDPEDPANVVATDPAATAIQAERDMKPGTRAAHDAQHLRDLRSDLAQRTLQDRAALNKAVQSNANSSSAAHSADQTAAVRPQSAKTLSHSQSQSNPPAPAAGREPSPAAGASSTSSDVARFNSFNRDIAPAGSPPPQSLNTGHGSVSTPPALASFSPPPAAVPSAPAVPTVESNSAAPPSGRLAAAARETVAIPTRDAPAQTRTTGDASNITTAAARRGPNPTDSSKSAPSAEATETRNSDANVERFLRVLRNRLGRDGGNLTVRLDPPSLGKLRVHMDIQRESLALTIDADTLLARRLLTDQTDALRQVVEAAGLRLERFEVRLAETDNAQSRRESNGSNDAPQHDDPRDAPNFDDRNAGQRHDDTRLGADLDDRRASRDQNDAADIEPQPDGVLFAKESDELDEPMNASLESTRARLRPTSISLWA